MFKIFTFLFLILFSPLALAQNQMDSKPCWEIPELQELEQSKRQKTKSRVRVFYDEGSKRAAKKILRYAKKADQKTLPKFFEFGVGDPFRIYVLKDRKIFERLLHKRIDWKSNWWVVGKALTTNDNVILNPEVWFKKSKDFVKVPQLVAHEMAHSYSLFFRPNPPKQECWIISEKELQKTKLVTSRVSYNYPFWLEEGLATVASGQMKHWGKTLRYNFKRFPHFESAIKAGGYALAATIIESMIEEFGKEKFFDAIRKLSSQKPQKNKDKYLSLYDALGKSKAELEQSWHKYVLKNYPMKKKKR